jgi:hypothetical protein
VSRPYPTGSLTPVARFYSIRMTPGAADHAMLR